MLIFKVKQSEAYTLFGKTRKKLFKVGLVIKDTTFSWDSKTNLFLWGGKKSYMNRLCYSMWGEQELFLLGVAGHAQSPAVGEPWWIQSSEKTRDSRPSLPMDAAQKRMVRRGRRTGLLPSPWLCHRTLPIASGSVSIRWFQGQEKQEGNPCTASCSG